MDGGALSIALCAACARRGRRPPRRARSASSTNGAGPARSRASSASRSRWRSTPAGTVYVADSENEPHPEVRRKRRLPRRMGRHGAGRRAVLDPGGGRRRRCGQRLRRRQGQLPGPEIHPRPGPSSPSGAATARGPGQFEAPEGIAADALGQRLRRRRRQQPDREVQPRPAPSSQSGARRQSRGPVQRARRRRHRRGRQRLRRRLGNDRDPEIHATAAPSSPNGARPGTTRRARLPGRASPPTPPAGSSSPTPATTGSRSSTLRQVPRRVGRPRQGPRASSTRRWRSRSLAAARSSSPTPATTGSRSSASCRPREYGKSVNVGVVSGIVRVHLPGSTKFIVLGDRPAAPGRHDRRRQPRPGAALLGEGTGGRHAERRLLLRRLPGAAAEGRQADHRAETGKPGSSARCKKGKRELAGVPARRRHGLWGSGKGNFRSEGQARLGDRARHDLVGAGPLRRDQVQSQTRRRHDP